MKELKYTIGDYVRVSTITARDKRADRVTWLKLHHFILEPRIGQVVGLCTRYDGRVGSERIHSYTDNFGWDSSYFIPSKSHRFWLVRFGLSNKPVCVADDDMRLATVDEVEDLPLQYPRQTWTERDKKNLSVDSVNWPRNSKGQWIAGPAIRH